MEKKVNIFWKDVARKAGLLPIIKRLLRRWWGRYPCVCGNPSERATGLTMDTVAKKVTHFWCAGCGGYRESPGKYRIEIENRNQGGANESC